MTAGPAVGSGAAGAGGLDPDSPSVERWRRPAVRRSVQIGRVRATYLPDGHVELHPERWYLLPETEDRTGREHLVSAEGYLTCSVGALLLEAPGWTVLIDAGLGTRHVPRPLTHPSLGAMRGGGLAGHAAELSRAEAVLFTHLHEDHTGWADDGWPGVPGLADVPHLAGRDEPGLGRRGWTGVADGEEIRPGLVALSSGGHTAGHTSYLVDGGDARLLVFGDVMHSPEQVGRPELASCFEADRSASEASRRAALELLRKEDVVGAGLHFADVVFGRVAGDAWEPVPDATD